VKIMIREYRKEITRLRENLEIHKAVILSGLEHENINFVIIFTLPTFEGIQGNLDSIEDLAKFDEEQTQITFENIKIQRKWNK